MLKNSFKQKQTVIRPKIFYFLDRREFPDGWSKANPVSEGAVSVCKAKRTTSPSTKEIQGSGQIVSKTKYSSASFHESK